MASDIDVLKAARSTLVASIAANAGKPDYNINGQQVAWSSIYAQLAQLNSQIAALEGPFEITTEFTTP